MVVEWPERHAHSRQPPRPVALSRNDSNLVMAAAAFAVAPALGDLPSPILHRAHRQLSHHAILIAGTPGFVDACHARVLDLVAERDLITMASFLLASPAASG